MKTKLKRHKSLKTKLNTWQKIKLKNNMLKIDEETGNFLLKKWAFLLVDTPEEKKLYVAWLLENQYNGVYSDNADPLTSAISQNNPITKAMNTEFKYNKWERKTKNVKIS